ncbi:hypothetical protein A4X09_0g6645 [Tilletia walkeri]|uniref:Uncharacterized protein n=1 Tax=Tilletia walkeri TaxID=117179 RepID=A0A8X7N4M1_9BASI|nr:hypothetical protein A4X09_0g6645 [Tilletia walkeri]
MSCRRRDRANDLSCNLGQLTISGCTLGCCGSIPELYPVCERMNVSSELNDAMRDPESHIRASCVPTVAAASSSETLLPRCLQYERWSTTSALNSMAQHTNSWPNSSGLIQQSQQRQYADGLMNAAYRPKYVCWDCRRTFKPTVCDGKRVVHTAQADKHGIAETTDGQSYLAPRRFQSPKKAEKDSNASSTYIRHPSSDPREQTVWAIHDDPGPHRTHQMMLKGANIWTNYGKGKKEATLLAAYQQHVFDKAEESYESTGEWEPRKREPNFPPECTTREEADAWLAAARASIPTELLPPRVVVTCCPACGEVGTRIESNFRAPKYKDIKAWKEARRRTEEEGEHWTFCLSEEEVSQMAELVELAKARDKVEQEGDHSEGGSEGYVSGKDRRREQELRAKLGLMKSKINVEGIGPLRDELQGLQPVRRI